MAGNGVSRLEHSARIVTGALLLGLVAALLWAVLSHTRPSAQVIDLVARQPTAGGWSRERIEVAQGQRVRLRIRSEDVVHGFAIAGLGVDAGRIEPGKTVTVEFVAGQPGEYTFYCTAWCDPSHPRMRGVLEIRDPTKMTPASPAAARDVALKDLDLPRGAPVIPAALPSASRGAALYAERCATCHGSKGQGTDRGNAIAQREALQDQTPVQIFQMLDGSHSTYARGWSQPDRWDAVAYLWSLRSSPERLEVGRRLFATNCAVCHGERGMGNGPGGARQPKKPANFTDARRMLAGSSALYTAKIRRGGMGTGMPYWGSIFSEEELAALVDFLWSFSLGTQR